jgi:transcriptional regulator with XRE-family HTH domain
MKSQKLASRNLALKFAILESGRTQRETAKRLRMDETRLSKIIGGEAIAYEREREKLAQLLGRPQSELFPVPESIAS